MRDPQGYLGAADAETETSRLALLRRAIGAAGSLVAMVAVLSVDGQIGPYTFPIRRAMVLFVSAAIAVPSLLRGRHWRTASWVGVIAALVVVGRAPTVPILLVGFVFMLAAFQVLPERSAARFPNALVPACLAYVGVRFASDLVPQANAIAQTVAEAASGYIIRARGTDTRLSSTALGGPAIALAVLYLLASWRRTGGLGRPIMAAALPMVWFALLPVVTPDVPAGPTMAFGRGVWHGLFWLGVAALVDAVPRRQASAAGTAARKPRAALRRMPRLTLAAPCVVAALAGLCLVGTALIGPPARRSILVHNHGGLDWDRPVSGRFGAFSAGMFGLLPVYSRAEGYDFRVIEHARASSPAEAAGPQTASKVAPTRADESASNAKPEPAESSRDSARRASPGGSGVRGSADLIAAIAGPEFSAASTFRRPAEVSLRYTDAIEPVDLVGAQVLILINSPKEWKDPDRRVVLDFAARGGSLLVLGDHTDVFGLMRGFNTLLGPLGIKFHFDSAYKARETWRGCQAAAPDLVACSWDEENPGVAVGASLELSGNARPLLVGRYAFSDAGMRENVMGSFLGNYQYDAGEQVGDIVLVATKTYGRGRIVVWGDTSAFQGGLSSNYGKVVGPMLTWLSRPAAWTEMPPVRIAAAIGLLAVVLWCWSVAATPKQLAAISASLLLGMLIPWALSLPNLNVRPHVDRDAVLIDRSHMEATGHYEARVNSVGALYTNLFRSGFRVLDMDDWDPKAIRRARGVAFVAPQKAFARGEVDELLRAEEDGAVVILTTGQPDSNGSQPLLDAHGFALVPRPMGTVTSAEPTASRREREQQPRFLDAWPIVARGGLDPETLPDVEVIYRQGDDVVALFRRVGKGGLLLIADTRFFSDMNVEDMSGYWLGNLALIHDLFKRYLGADPDAVKPLFRSPEKPQ
jgi:hypothetical protein